MVIGAVADVFVVLAPVPPTGTDAERMETGVITESCGSGAGMKKAA